MKYFNLDIIITTGNPNPSEAASSGGKKYDVYAHFSKGGEAKATMQFPFDKRTLTKRLADVKRGLYSTQANSRVSLSEKEQRIQEFGRELFNALFCGRIHTLYEAVKRGLNREDEERLRIRLRIHSPELAVLPWELMYDPYAHSYLCQNRSISLVRYQELEDSCTPLRLELPLNILGMVATPNDQQRLDIESEKDTIGRQLNPFSDSVTLKWVPGSGWDDLRKEMRDGHWHIFHFIGHGRFSVRKHEGFLIFVDKDGASKPVNARALSVLLDQHPSLKLIVLNSCEGARGSSADAFSSTASILARKNIPAIIAMQYEITDNASIVFAGAFYETLAKGQPIDAALFEARIALMGIQSSIEWAIPVLHMRSRDENLFIIPPKRSKPTIVLPRQTGGLSRTLFQPLRFFSKILPQTQIFGGRNSRRFYVSLVSIILILLLILGGVFVLPFILSIPSPNPFPALCSGNFQSAIIAAVPTPATSTSPDEQPIGLSEGANIFDLDRPNEQEIQYKLQAAQDWMNDPQGVVSSLNNALSSDPTDAEAQIFRENWKVLGSNHPHITLVVGVSFAANSAGASRGALQGAYTAQKECNDLNRSNSSKTQIVLMIANIGGNNPADRASSAKFVANQIANQAAQDKTIVGIMAWPTSTDTINVNVQLKNGGSSLPMVSLSASSDDLGGMSHFFRVCPLNRQEAQTAADFLLNTKHKKKIAIVYDQTTAFSTNLKDDFAKDIPKKKTVGSASFIGDDPKTLQDTLTNMLAQKPDAIFFSGYVNDLFVLLKIISSNTQANNILIVGGDALATTNSYPIPLPDLQGVYFTSFASPNQWDDISPKPPFFQDYKDNFGTITAPNGLSSIDTHALLGYDALLTLLHGTQQTLSKQSTITPSDLTGELKKITGTNAIQGVTGRIAFDNNGDQDPSKMIFVEHIEGTNLVIDERHGCLQKDHCSS